LKGDFTTRIFGDKLPDIESVYIQEQVNSMYSISIFANVFTSLCVDV